MSIDILKDQRIVMTLDAGGTNFVFSALKGTRAIVEPIRKPSYGDQLEKSLNTIIEGFKEVKSQLTEEAVAISFAFPGPADYPKGIIGDLNNLKAYRGGVALGPMLERIFNIPVFINNDGDLYAYGESIAGFLPYVNQKMEEAGLQKRYKNLVGITLGTGLGGGIVTDGNLLLGDNSLGSEIWLFRNRHNPATNAEEGACIRAVQNIYASETANKDHQLSPKDIYEIAIGEKEGDKEAALKAFKHLGKALGDVLALLSTLIDGVIVIGGGLSGAHQLFMPAVLEEMNANFENPKGEKFRRLTAEVCDLSTEEGMSELCDIHEASVKIPFTDENINYSSDSKIGVGISQIGTSEAIAIGAYAYALNHL